jgi:hypothetical protein
VRGLAVACRAILCLAVPALLVTGRGEAAPVAMIAASCGLVLAWSRAPSSLQVLFLAPLTGAIWAAGFGATADSATFSTAAHTFLSAAVTPLLFLAVARTGALQTQPGGGLQRTGLFFVAVGLTSALAIGWELVEWCSDALLDTHMSLGKGDLLGDLAADLVGASIGALITVSLVLNRYPDQAGPPSVRTSRDRRRP